MVPYIREVQAKAHGFCTEQSICFHLVKAFQALFTGAWYPGRALPSLRDTQWLPVCGCMHSLQEPQETQEMPCSGAAGFNPWAGPPMAGDSGLL